MILSELLKAGQVDTPFDANIEITGIACDSRKVKKGYLFVALKGVKENGEDYIPAAIKNGAVAVLLDHTINADVPTFETQDVRKAFALICAHYYNKKPQTLVAVTGTNGKTSTVFFVREILEALGKSAATLGTLGVQSGKFTSYGGMTTSDSLTLNQDLETLAENGVEYAALEASSHGLAQHRLSGLEFKASAFTNLTRDHLDYHGTMENYLKAKLKLFTELTKEVAVLNADIEEFELIKDACLKKGLRVISYGKKGQDIRLIKQELKETSQTLDLQIFGKDYHVDIPVAGNFQGMNILTAIGLVIGCGFDVEDILKTLKNLKSPSGRMELVAKTKAGAPIFVDYAHTPDGLENALNSLRAQTKGRLMVVFGCGGNRDTGKRPIMGQIAERIADYVVVTDDNPRFENAGEIRAQIMKGCPNARPIGDRAKAIYHAIHKLQANDTLLIAGKGHEEGQLINGFMHPFNDKIQAQLALRSQEEKPLWTSDELKHATGGKSYKTFVAYGVSIDTRTLQPGDIFIALKGEKVDGHNYVKEALKKGAVAAIVSQDVENITQTEKLFFVVNTDEALEDMARYAAQNSRAMKIGITGSSGKTTSKEMLALALQGQGTVHATKGNLNNQWGVPLTLARLPRLSNWAIIEMGMNHTGEMEYLSYLVKPDVALITMVGSAHHEFFKTIEDIAAAKAEIFTHMNKNGAVFLNKDNAMFDFLKQKAAENGLSHIYSFGSAEGSTVRLINYHIDEAGSRAIIHVNGKEKELKLQMAGLHFIQNALGVLGVVLSLNADVDKAIENLAQMKPLKGRGALVKGSVMGKSITFIDDCYNANPSSMTASLNVLGANHGRKVAVIGEMRELGEKSAALHQGLNDSIARNHIDLVFCVGAETKPLYDILPDTIKGGFFESAPEVINTLQSRLEDGDVVLIKGSNSMKMNVIMEKLMRQ